MFNNLDAQIRDTFHKVGGYKRFIEYSDLTIFLAGHLSGLILGAFVSALIFMTVKFNYNMEQYFAIHLEDDAGNSQLYANPRNLHQALMLFILTFLWKIGIRPRKKQSVVRFNQRLARIALVLGWLDLIIMLIIIAIGIFNALTIVMPNGHVRFLFKD